MSIPIPMTSCASRHTPRGRGYDTSLFYFHHDNDYWQDRVRLDDRAVNGTCPGKCSDTDDSSTSLPDDSSTSLRYFLVYSIGH